MTIVVVDDEPTIVRMCVQVLQSKGHTVHGFTRADEALAHLTSQTAELLVVDYRMPELSGLEFIKRAWEVRPRVRVVMITAGLVFAPWGGLPWAIVALCATAWLTVVQRVLHVRKQLSSSGGTNVR